MSKQTVIHGKSEEVLKQFPDNHFHGIVTDPPYGLSFMGKKWDYDVPSIDLWKEVFRVLKPGGHILVACGTRTQHRMGVNIEDAGFEIRDVITWHYGSGFPKSHDISKGIDSQAGAVREVLKEKIRLGDSKPYAINPSSESTSYRLGNGDGAYNTKGFETAPATPEAKQWQGWGTALKPATEFWTLARKPLEKSTVAENVLKHGTGGINIDGCRVGYEVRFNAGAGNKAGGNSLNMSLVGMPENFKGTEATGRFPANLILDEFAADVLDQQTGVLKSGKIEKHHKAGKEDGTLYNYGIYGNRNGISSESYGDSGGASRFFYVAKASQSERNKGLDELPDRQGGFMSNTSGQHLTRRDGGAPGPVKNHHPTVKPIKLMEYLVKLITPPGGIVCDPFNGSGSTGCACALNDISYVGIEAQEDYVAISEARIKHHQEIYIDELNQMLGL